MAEPRHMGMQASPAPREPRGEGPREDVPHGDAPHGEEPRATVGRSAALMGVLVTVSRITGFFRTWGQAYALGVTVLASCYSVANNLPNLLYELVIGGMLVTAFLPVYLSVKQRSGREAANDYASNLLSLVFIVMGAVTIVCLVFAVQMVWTQSYSATSDFDQDTTVYLFRFFVVEVLLYSLSTIVSGILNAERDYLWSSAAPIFNNFVCLASFFLFAAFSSSNPALALVLLALGNPLGVLVQVLVQLPSLRRHGVRITWRVDVHDPAIRETLSIGIPSLVVTVVMFVTVSVQTSSALSVTAQGASIAYYTRLWYTLPYAILAVPITTTMFTELSSAAAAGRMGEYRREVAEGTSQILFLLIPFAMFLVVFADTLITLLAAGRFSAADIRETASYLQVLAISLPVYGVSTYLQKICSSLREMRSYAVANIIAGVAQVACCVWLTPLFGLNVVALSSLAFFVAVDIAGFWLLRNRLEGLDHKAIGLAAVRGIALGLAGSVVGMGILALLANLAGPLGSSMLRAFLFAIAAGIPSVVVTFGLAMVLRIPEASYLRSLMRRLLHR